MIFTACRGEFHITGPQCASCSRIELSLAIHLLSKGPFKGTGVQQPQHFPSEFGEWDADNISYIWEVTALQSVSGQDKWATNP